MPRNIPAESKARKDYKFSIPKKSGTLSKISGAYQGNAAAKMARAKAISLSVGLDSCDMSDYQSAYRHMNKRYKKIESARALSPKMLRQVQNGLLVEGATGIQITPKMETWDKTKMLFPVSANLEGLLEKHLAPLTETSKKIIKANKEIERLANIKVYKEYDYREEINDQFEGIMMSMVDGLRMSKKDSVTISENGRFKDSICYEIIEILGLEYRNPTPFLDRLYREVAEVVKDERRERYWGSIGFQDEELTLFA